jgi:hypothetical protein
MEKYLLVFFLVLRISTQGQTPGVNNIDSLIKEIRKNVNEINTDSAAEKKVVVDLEGESAEGGELTKVYKGKYLCKGILTFYGETGKLNKEYYFSKGRLLFLYEQRYFYNAPITEKESKITNIEENRYYFDKGELIQWKKGLKIVGQKYYPAKMKELNKEQKKYFLN